MCGRYYVGNEEGTIEMREILDEITDRYADSSMLLAMKTGEIFPTEIAPVLTASGSGQKAELMKWGFPRGSASGVIINAKAETASEKFLFRNCLAERRCLVPASAFFEWKEAAPKNKVKYMFRSAGENILFFAGLYNIYRDDKGMILPAFVILTTAANGSVSSIHGRMPFVLVGDKKNIWLHDERLSGSLLNSRCDAELTREAV
jgi:putative SOS response-associated peptidase YedK